MIHISIPIAYVIFIVLGVFIALLFENETDLDESPSMAVSIIFNLLVFSSYFAVGYYWNSWKW